MSLPFARLAVVAAAAALALPLAARAALPDAVHVMSVALPDGSVARIHYVGEVPPTLTMTAPPIATRVAMETASPFPFIPAAFATPFGGNPFAVLARLDAAMQRGADAMLVRAAAMENATPQNGTGLVPVVLAGGAPGACVQGTRITEVNGAAPQVVSFRSAGCGAVAASPTAAFGAATGTLPGRASPILSQPDAVPGAARALNDPTPQVIEAVDDGTTPLSLIH